MIATDLGGSFVHASHADSSGSESKSEPGFLARFGAHARISPIVRLGGAISFQASHDLIGLSAMPELHLRPFGESWYLRLGSGIVALSGFGGDHWGARFSGAIGRDVLFGGGRLGLFVGLDLDSLRAGGSSLRLVSPSVGVSTRAF